MKLTIKKQLVIALILVGILPFITVGIVSYIKASKAIIQEAYSKLETARDIKIKQIEQLIHFRKADMKVLAKSPSVNKLLNSFEKIEKRLKIDPNKPYPINSKLIKQEANKYDAYFKHFITTYNYRNIYLINAKSGQVMYSAIKRSDQGVNLNFSALRNSGLGEVFHLVMQSKKVSLVDIKPYEPDNHHPALFMGAPNFKDDKLRAVIVIEIDAKMIIDIMQNRSGMGKTGETYIVGSDGKMRSDSFSHPKTHTVKESFANPQHGSVHTVAYKEAFKGENSSQIINNFAGTKVLSSYTLLELSKKINAKFKWALIAEIEVLEIKKPVVSLRNSAILSGLIFLVIILGIAFFLARFISNPIIIAVGSISNANSEVIIASDQIADSSTSLAEGASEQASSVEEVSASLEESSALISKNSDHAKDANNLAHEADNAAKLGNDKVQDLMIAMNGISKSSERISKIIKTIDEIAFQTNLLALNAAVEAARAGDHGLGFAVVAEEVKNLAGRSATAAKETAEIIESSIVQVKTGNTIAKETNEAFGNILESIKKTSNLIGEISISAKEQSEGMGQISSAMAQVDQVTQHNASTSQEVASAAEELNGQANAMLDVVASIGAMVGVNISANKKHATANRSLINHKQSIKKVKENSIEQEADVNEVFPLDDDDLKEF